jgi:hypothetical protein
MEFFLPGLGMMGAYAVGWGCGIYLTFLYLTRRDRAIQNTLWRRFWGNGLLSIVIGGLSVLFSQSGDIASNAGYFLLFGAPPILFGTAALLYRKAKRLQAGLIR